MESSSASNLNTDLAAFCIPTPPPATKAHSEKIQILRLNIAKKKKIVDTVIPIKNVCFDPFLFKILYEKNNY